MTAAAKKRGKTRFGSLRSVLLFVAGIFLMLFIAMILLHPYSRLERLAGDLLARHAPPGTTISGIEFSFPATIVLTDVVLPVQMDDQPRQIQAEKVTGKISILPLLKGLVDAEMNSDFFGGLLWLKLRTDQAPNKSNEGAAPIAVEARARRMDISKLCEFFQAPVTATGSCDVDVEAELDENDFTTVSGQSLVIGERMEIPPLDLDKLMLPRNQNGRFLAKLKAGEGKVIIDSFRFEGTAYNLAGKGVILLTDPAEDSRVDCSMAMVFKEHFVITDGRLSGKQAEDIAEALVTTRSKMFFRLSGTIKEPQAQFDPASSLGPIIEQLSR